MVPSHPSPPRAQPVALRVRDIGASRTFFQELFGLEPAPGFPETDDAVVLASPVPGHHHFCIKLTTGPVPVRLAGVHVELETTNELLDLYFLALLGGFRTSELRFRRGSLSTTITDPDGHTVEVVAHHAGSNFHAPAASRHWPIPRPAACATAPGRDAGGPGQNLIDDHAPGRRVPADAAAPGGDHHRRPNRSPRGMAR